MAIFGLILAMFLTSQPYDFDAIAHMGLLYDVERLENFVRTLQCIGKLFCCLSWNPGHENSAACPWNACLWNPGLMT